MNCIYCNVEASPERPMVPEFWGSIRYMCADRIRCCMDMVNKANTPEEKERLEAVIDSAAHYLETYNFLYGQESYA